MKSNNVLIALVPVSIVAAVLIGSAVSQQRSDPTAVEAVGQRAADHPIRTDAFIDLVVGQLILAGFEEALIVFAARR